MELTQEQTNSFNDQLFVATEKIDTLRSQLSNKNSLTSNTSTGIGNVTAADLISSNIPIDVPDTSSTQAIGGQTVQSFVASLDPIITPDTAESQRLGEIREELNDSRSFSTADVFQDAFSQAGGEQAQKELSEINLQVARRKAAFDSLTSDISSIEGQTKVGELASISEVNRQAAVELGALAAVQLAAQANFDTARQVALDTANFASADRQNDLQLLNAELNALEPTLNAQQTQLLQQQQLLIQAELDEIDRTNEEVSSAIASGSATTEEALSLTSSTVSNSDKLALAQTIQSRAATQTRDLELQQARASIQASQSATALNQFELQAAQEKALQLEEAVATGAIILDEDQKSDAQALSKQFESEANEFKAQVGAFNRIVASAEDPSAAGDLALIFNYMKMLDPGSVVREGEFANAQNSAGVPQRIRAQYNNVINGERLSSAIRDDFVDRSTKIYDASLEQQIDLEDRFRDQATQLYGLPQNAAELVVRDIRATGATSEVIFNTQLNGASDEQLNFLINSGLMNSSTPNSI